MGLNHSVNVVIEKYEPELYNSMVKGLEREPERGARCTKCFNMRLLKSAEFASEYEYDYYSTTLTISPHKNADLINELGSIIAKQQDIEWLYTDFKKKNGYKRSIELSAEYNLYRQNFCGCIHSKRQREEEIEFHEKINMEKEKGK
jgi:predicted adenine nucleotide alpha hydrolase (AANH) superfamily ATPase